MGISYTPRTWAALEVVNETELNTEIRDPFNGLMAAWAAYTPVLTNWTLGNGTISGAYQQIGKTILWRAQFIFGSTSVATGNFLISLPVAHNQPASSPVGSYRQLTGQTSTGVVTANNAAGTTAAACVFMSGATTVGVLSATAPAAPTSGNVIDLGGCYEAQ